MFFFKCLTLAQESRRNLVGDSERLANDGFVVENELGDQIVDEVFDDVTALRRFKRTNLDAGREDKGLVASWETQVRLGEVRGNTK